MILIRGTRIKLENGLIGTIERHNITSRGFVIYDVNLDNNCYAYVKGTDNFIVLGEGQ
jgi:hypothetical protein